MMFLLLTLNVFHNFCSVFIADFEKVNIRWEEASQYSAAWKDTL